MPPPTASPPLPPEPATALLPAIGLSVNVAFPTPLDAERAMPPPVLEPPLAAPVPALAELLEIDTAVNVTVPLALLTVVSARSIPPPAAANPILPVPPVIWLLVNDPEVKVRLVLAT